MPVERVLADFEGRWEIERAIAPRAGPPARFAGVATWAARGGDLAYAEEGTLRIEGSPPLLAARRYLWTPGLHVYFDDGRFFHTVPAGGGEAWHWCDPDAYRASYDFSGWPAFRTTWTVDGPRKSYAMTSLYRRAASLPAAPAGANAAPALAGRAGARQKAAGLASREEVESHGIDMGQQGAERGARRE